MLKKNKSKHSKNVILIIALLLLISGMICFYMYKDTIMPYIKNMTNSVNNKYSFVKYSDDSSDVNKIAVKGDYKIFYNGDTPYFNMPESKKNTLTIYKNDHMINLNKKHNEVFSFVGNTDLLYSTKLGIDSNRNTKETYQFVDYKNIGLPTDEFSYISQIDDTNHVILGKDGKYGIYDIKKAKYICPLIYDDLWTVENSELLIATKNDKVGVIDHFNNIHVSFDYDTPESVNHYCIDLYGYPIEVTSSSLINGKHYFILNKGNDVVAVSEDNKELRSWPYIEDKLVIKYSYLVVLNGNTQEYYTYDGKLAKTIEIPSWANPNSSGINAIGTEKILLHFSEDRKRIFTINSKLETKEYKDVYYKFANVPSSPDTFLGTYIYITFKNGRYYFYDTENDKELGNYSFFRDHDFTSTTLVCEDDKCGELDEKGNLLTELKYANDEHLFRNLKCDNYGDDSRFDFNNYYYFGHYSKDDLNLYYKDCNNIIEEKIDHIYKLNEKYVFVIKDEKCYIFDNEGKKKELSYPSEERYFDIKYLGKDNGKLYIKTDEGIYYYKYD